MIKRLATLINKCADSIDSQKQFRTEDFLQENAVIQMIRAAAACWSNIVYF